MSELLAESGVEMVAEELEKSFKPHTVDYEHFYNLCLKRLPTKDPNVFRVSITGHHLDKFKQLEKAGIVKYTNVKTYPNGFWEADVNFMGLVKPNNCYFPENWNEVEVMKAAIKILENPETVKLESSKHLILEGTYATSEIRLVLKNTNKLSTVYPLKR